MALLLTFGWRADDASTAFTGVWVVLATGYAWVSARLLDRALDDKRPAREVVAAETARTSRQSSNKPNLSSKRRGT